ncbi:lysylphosphatidylglycerol synthase transmembrane domain-containing protein [Crocosphaera sp.]|uniref:lysylphosphatidylglycerol synthase transmembrane domain-containing protein n=1 Tax=Crocosphaera sp. TaxID=2729996 RepID=UPI003F245EE3|nr:lysylphosphatidylglycerol synthase transmembrane domain-containing protein [Crocosphaera sp.]
MIKSQVKKVVLTLVSLLIGSLLIWLTFRFTNINIEQILTQLKELNLAFVIFIPLTTFMTFLILAYRWRLTIQKLVPNLTKSKRFYVFYIALSDLIGIFTPRQISVLTTQSIVLKIHKVGSLSQGFLSALYNQFMNLFIPFILIPTSLSLMLGYISESLAIFLATLTLYIVLYLLRKWHNVLVNWLIQGYSFIKNRLSGNKNISSLSENTTKGTMFDQKFITLQFLLTLMLHLSLSLRNFLVVKAIGLNIPFSYIFAATVLVYLAMVLSFTPGNLGLMEWSWIGVLRLMNISAYDAATFALIQRFLVTLSIIIVFTLCVIFLWLDRTMKNGNAKS